MTRTSQTHPLQIAEVQYAEGYGTIGITFCPGKKQKGAFTGDWDRNLRMDVDMIEDWNAAAVVTLLEEPELEALGVSDLGTIIQSDWMAWYYLPVRDVSTPSEAFEAEWAFAGEELRTLLRDGFNVLVHCKGGLGRAGMIAARLLIELGMDPNQAITRVRDARPGAIETSAQHDYVAALATIPERQPDQSREAIEDRAIGALLGLAVGDALGTTYEFELRDRNPRLTDMVGGGPFRLRRGEWTDDTAMALALADSLIAHEGLDEEDLMERFVDWYEKGTYSCTGHCFDIGITTRNALSRWKQSGDPFAGSTNPNTAGNGSLMRLAPVAIRYWNQLPVLRDVAARQSRATHGAPEAVDACVAYAEVLAHAIAGRTRSEMLQLTCEPGAKAIWQIMGGSWSGKRRDDIKSSGYVAHSLEASLWSVGRTACFEEAVVLAANLADDADTTAAITGQLAGAIYGADRIPAHWLVELAWGTRIRATAKALFEASWPS